MRISALAILAAAMMSAGCQQNAVHPMESIDDDKESTGVFDSRFDSAMGRILIPVQMNCALEKPSGSEGEIDDFLDAPLGDNALGKCFIANFHRVFDVPAEGRDTCNGLSTVKKISICLISGSYVRDMHLENGENVPPVLWKDPGRALEAMVRRFADEEVELCYYAGSRGHRLRECALNAILRRLEVSESEAKKCDRFDEDEVNGKCLGEAAITRYLESKAWEKQV
jgi:hypothetical protein